MYVGHNSESVKFVVFVKLCFEVRGGHLWIMSKMRLLAIVLVLYVAYAAVSGYLIF